MSPTRRLRFTALACGTAVVLTGTAVAGNAAAAPPAPSTPVTSSAPLATYRASLLQWSGQIEQQLTALGQHEPSVARSGAAGTVAAARRLIHDMPEKQLAVLFQATGDNTTLIALPQALAAVTKDTVAKPMSAVTAAPAAPAGVKANAAPSGVKANAVAPALVAAPDCGTAPDPSAVHDAQIAIASAQVALASIPQAIVAGAVIAGEGGVVTAPDPAYATAAAVLQAAQVVVDDQQFQIDQLNNCQEAAHINLLIDVANNLQGDTTNILNAVGGVSTLVDGRTNTIITKTDALNTLLDTRTTTIINNGQALSQLVDSRTNTIITKTDALNSLVDTRTTTIIGQNNLALKVSIEQALVENGATGIATFELPASAGGYFDAQPVGVKAIVTDTLAKMQATHQSVGGDAIGALAAANSALAAGNYKNAYQLYQKAYQSMVK